MRVVCCALPSGVPFGAAMEFGLAMSRAAHNSALCISFIRKCAEADLRAIEPLLRKAADYEIRTTMPLSDVVAAVLRLAGA